MTLVDDTSIYVGDYTLFGPNVTLATAGHHVLPELRKQGYQFNVPIYIGKNCWLGAGVIVLPRIKIGDNAVVVAGSVATKDLPDNVVAVGNHCHILRKVNEHDKDFILKIKRYIWLNIYVKGSALRNWVYYITIIYFIVS